LTRRLRPLPRPEAGAARLRPRKAQPPCPATQRAYDGRCFSFLNRTVPFDGADRWQPAGVSRLWLYRLHGFSWLAHLDAPEGARLIVDWVRSNWQVRGAAWEPYPISLRAREWIEFLAAYPEALQGEQVTILACLVRQLEVLRTRLEYHLLGNHLLENAITLCWAGLSLEAAPARRWLDVGRSLLREQLGLQVLADGCHDERSPMYQAALAEVLLRLAGVAGSYTGAEAAEIGSSAGTQGTRLAGSLERLTHPDGEIALINDSALGEAPNAAALRARFALERADLAHGPWSLESAGYLGWSSDEDYLVLDGGPIGPDHQPGHGHAGALSFEASHRGVRLVTDTGVLTYEPGPKRAWDRSTAAHSTVEVDGRDQSEVWAAFRCGRRIAPLGTATLAEEGGGASLVAAYRGPGTTRAGVRHQRALQVSSWGIRGYDAIVTKGSHEATLRLHLGVGLELQDSEAGVVVSDGRTPIAEVFADRFDWTVEETPYHPRFGVEVTRPCLTARFGFIDDLELSWSIRFL
jgi:uncharacterized heparinase superfamily protein